MDACRRLIRHAEGDYAPDRAERRFPQEPFSRQPEATSANIWELFDAWALESKPTSQTLSGYRFNIGQFVESVGHADARRYTRTDVLRWKDGMVGAGIPAKTIDSAKLASLKAVLNHAVENERIPTNPASKVSVGKRGKGKVGTKMLGYDDHEAQTILAAAIVDLRPAIRWVPLLCAMTGARVGEMMQLRREDVFIDGGVWSIKVTEDAGNLKNASSERVVPVHPSLIERGFLVFASGQPKGPMFYKRDRLRAGSNAKPGKGARLRPMPHSQTGSKFA